MASMPLIDDDMVLLFRRSGKRRASYRPAQNGRRAAVAQRVVLQDNGQCEFDGQACIDENGAIGKCVQGICMKNPFPGPRPFEF